MSEAFPSSGADCAYRPLSDDDSWLRALAPMSALLLGPESDELAARIAATGAADARVSRASRRTGRLPSGVYAFLSGGDWHSLWVTGGRPQQSAQDGRLAFNTDHLGEAVYAHEDEWDSAAPLLGDSPVHAGALVAVTGRSGWGRVVRVRRLDAGHTADVDIAGNIENFEVNDLTALDGDLRDPDFWISRGPAEAEDVARTLSWVKLAYPLSDTLYSYAATKTIFKPYQFIPVLKMLGSETGKILIADEVGLGKTIEAGLIWTELEQRHPIRRALVVVPASLKIKWRQEMDRRFMRSLPELGLGDLATFLDDIGDGKDAEITGVVSIESIRRAPDLLARFTELAPQFDLVIVDEAHALRNAGTGSHEVGVTLGALADRLVFLSATPLNLGTDDLFTLVSLLDPGGFPDKRVFSSQLEPNAHLNAIARNMADPLRRSKSISLAELEALRLTEQGEALAGRPTFERLEELLKEERPATTDDIARVKRYTSDLNTLGSVVTRTRKIDVPGKKAIREAHQLDVEWTPQERALYNAIYADVFNRAKKTNVPLGFAMQMPLRQACSSLIVAQERLADRRGWTLDDVDEIDDEQLSRTEVGDESSVNDDLGEELDDLLRADALRRALDHDTKLGVLRAHLLKARVNGMPQALIFSFFRGTVNYLAEKLGPDFRTEVLHGGVPMEDREAVIQRFREGEIDLLIANQVGSEGLDFEFCNVLVNYDLPWNPMQVEQRIGRLDRFGQLSDKIHIFNMFTPDTIESDIFGRLYARIGVFERSIGDLEPIIRGGLSELHAEVLNPNLSDDQKIRAIDRFEVAVIQESERAKALEDQSGMLTSLALLDVEGLSEAGPTKGRYVGAAELRGLLSTALRAKEGRLDPTSDERLWSIHGSPALSTALSAYRRDRVGTMHGIAKLQGMIRDGDPVSVTFDPSHARVSMVELITARHPLIRFAVDHLAEHRDDLARFGRVGLAGLDAGASFVATVDLVRTAGGLRDQQELWVTALNLASDEIADEIPDLLMTALAEGSLRLSPGHLPTDAVLRARSRLQAVVTARRATERAERRQENDALVEARLVSERKSLRIQLDRARDVLATAEMNDRRDSILRMHQGHIRNLNARLAELDHRFDAKRDVAMSVEHVAVLLVTGLGG
jgi:SNF2 family DNA or RNA helicase